MPRDMAPNDIADLVARAEQVKRNREIILRRRQPKPRTTPAPRSGATVCHLKTYLRVREPVATES